MSVLIELGASGPLVKAQPVERPVFTPRQPANDGQGDVRKKIVPVIKPPAGPSVEEWEGGRFKSLDEWLSDGVGGGAILLQPSDDVRRLRDLTGRLGMIAVDFHRIGDGRGYTHAFLLRRQLGYDGTLRAVGAVTADQMFALAQVGFDSFALREGQTPEAALTALSAFSLTYQGSIVAGGAEERAAAAFEARIRLLERAVRGIAAAHGRPALASSFSAEDMVLIDVIARTRVAIDVFTLDTGRLHEETLALIDETRARYGIDVLIHRPDDKAVSAYVAAHGVDGFYTSVAKRKLCCQIRKVAPLNEALDGRDAWMTGQRREQALSRAALLEQQVDAERGIAKYNPLADWLWPDVLAYCARFETPMNALYRRGYVSIGCEPCTKAIRPGQDPREGRWWWENDESKECGLHQNEAALTT